MKSIKRLFLALTAIFALTAFAPLAAPSRPGLYSPVNKAVQVDPDAVTLKWKKSTPSPSSVPISDYEVEVSDSSAVDPDGSFSNVIDSESSVAAPTVTYLITAGILDYGSTYYWHVRANPSGTPSAWSSIGVFRVAVEPPTIVPLTAPDLLTLRPPFKWTPGAQSADSYTIQISMDSGFSTIYRTATILYSAEPPNQYIPTADLTFATDFHWRVRANNSALGTSAWSIAGDFTTANPPTVPVLVSPNKTKVTPTPLLTWKQVSLQSGVLFGKYEIEIFDTNVDIGTVTPKFTADDTVDASLGLKATTSYSVPESAGLLPATTYYWHLKAYNADDEYSTSSLFIFYTTIDGKIDSATMNPGRVLGNVPGLEDPVDVSTKVIDGFAGPNHETINLLSLRPTFKWDAGSMNAETFTLQVASKVSGGCNVGDPKESTFESKTLIINVTVSNSDAEYTANFDKYPGYTLCWRIRGNHPLYGSSEWSDVQVFLTANPPSIPVIVDPKDGTLTNDNSPRFVWGKVSLPSGSTFAKYEVEISYSSSFTGYDYPDTVPPYPDTVSYPIDAPIMPGDTVLLPEYSITPPDSLFPKIPMIDQAHNPITEEANSLSQPWYDVEPDTLTGGNPLYGAHTYYWRVRAYNGNGEYSGWSVSRSIKITPDRPTDLRLTDCATPGVTISDPIDPRPCFEWDPIYKANKYTIYIATTPNFGASSIVIASTSSLKYQPIKDLPRDQDLFWRVSAIDTVRYGQGLYSDPVKSFRSANPPDAPALLAPIKNKLEYATTPTFFWTIPYIPFGTTFDYYEIAIAYDPNFAYLVEDPPAQTTGDIFDTEYTIAPSLLDPAMKYYWRVRACNTTPECSSWSPMADFRIALEAPIVDPAPIDTNILRPIFQWDHVNYASGYYIRISKNPACSTSTISAKTSATVTSYQPKKNLVIGTTYYWCVQASNKVYGPSAWSTIETYTP